MWCGSHIIRLSRDSVTIHRTKQILDSKPWERVDKVQPRIDRELLLRLVKQGPKPDHDEEVTECDTVLANYIPSVSPFHW